jgi:hypothetical protein
MTNRDELRDIWQSQPLDKQGDPVPKFRLIDDATTPFYMPLSRGRRISYGAGLIWMALFVWRGHGTEWPHYAAIAIAVALAVTGLSVLARSQDRSRTSQYEETVSSYRSAVASEFDRQFRIEKLIVFLLFGGMIAVSFVELLGTLLIRGSVDARPIGMAAFGVGALIVGMRLATRSAKAVISQLKDT